MNSHALASRFREVLLSGKWICNTNFKEQLDQTTWQQATTQIANLNNIALLTFHINYYIDGINHVFDGGTLDIRDKYSFDAPPITSAKDWGRLCEELYTNAEKFANHIAAFTDEQLGQPFVDEKYGTYLRNIDGMIEHAYYHLAQIVLLRKMQRS